MLRVSSSSLLSLRDGETVATATEIQDVVPNPLISDQTQSDIRHHYVSFIIYAARILYRPVLLGRH